jgi:hypothetical protein
VEVYGEDGQMCQKCVEDGTLTQEEFEARRAAGDQSVLPLIELPLDEFLDQVSLAAAEYGMRTMNPRNGIVFLDGGIDVYREAHPEVTSQDITAAVRKVRDRVRDALAGGQ